MKRLITMLIAMMALPLLTLWAGALVLEVGKADATPEALGWSLANGWPSAGVMSSEAGIVFGGHGMSPDSVMRNLSLMNVLWDGATHRVERRSAEPYTLAGVRLTMGLAAQPETVRQFMEGAKGLARGNGFAARFCNPIRNAGEQHDRNGHEDGE